MSVCVPQSPSMPITPLPGGARHNFDKSWNGSPPRHWLLRWRGEETGRQRDGWTDGQTDGWADRQTDRRTCRRTDRQHKTKLWWMRRQVAHHNTKNYLYLPK